MPVISTIEDTEDLWLMLMLVSVATYIGVGIGTVPVVRWPAVMEGCENCTNHRTLQLIVSTALRTALLLLVLPFYKYQVAAMRKYIPRRFRTSPPRLVHTNPARKGKLLRFTGIGLAGILGMVADIAEGVIL